MTEAKHDERTLLLGDEAVALAAVHAGISGAYGYPGTPSTEILETLIEHAAKHGGPLAHWSTNEKTAYEQALGVSLVGRRALVTMKHVGLNVAADAFMSSALVTLHGGLVLAVADDPGMHSSQNEQDSRFFAEFARTPCFEPASQQEAYDMTREAFEVSERFHIPVMLRLVTRLAHSRGVVAMRPPRAENELKKAPSAASWILIPSNARRQWHERVTNYKSLLGYAEESPFNTVAAGRDFGVITTGTARTSYLECVNELVRTPAHLHVGVYPPPMNRIREFVRGLKKVLVLEEGYPLIEKALRGVIAPEGLEIQGKENAVVPPEGELSADLVRKALDLPRRTGLKLMGGDVPARPPRLCPGCPHVDSFGMLTGALEGFGVKLVTSDIGCYALGAMPEHNAIETCVCMGASVGLAKGAADAGLYPVVAAIGDSTFLHSGMTPLLDAVAHDTNMTLLILDNETVGMTGGQTTIVPSARLKDLVLGLGVPPEHVHVVTAHRKFHEENTRILRQEVEHRGISVVIAVRECVETAKRKRVETP